MVPASDDWQLQRPKADRRWLRLWFGAIAATTLLVVVVGGITRLTQAGLSIVDWQPLVGIVPPLAGSDWADSFERYQQYPEYRQLRPSMTLVEYKRIFFWEYLHRALARAIGLVGVAPFAWFWLKGSLTRPIARRAAALVALGSAQGVVGWLMVRSGLVDRPSVSHYGLATHLCLAVGIFAFSIWLVRDLSLGPTRRTTTAITRRRAIHALLTVGGLLGLQITWGALVAGLKAGQMFGTFPLMDGALVPASYWTLNPFALNLVQHPAGVQWLHRLLGTLLLIAAAAAWLRMRQMRMDLASRALSGALLAAIATQYALGVLTLLWAVPIVLAAAHQAMALAVVAVWVSAIHHVRHLAAAPLGG